MLRTPFTKDSDCFLEFSQLNFVFFSFGTQVNTNENDFIAEQGPGFLVDFNLVYLFICKLEDILDLRQ